MSITDEAVEVFYDHYHKAHKDETCYQAVCRAIAKVVEFVETGQRPTKERQPEQAELFPEVTT